MGAKRRSTKQSTNEAKSALAVSYNEFKEHEGQRYTGMKIGRSHKWYYDKGEWKEKKITQDQASRWGPSITGTSWPIRTPRNEPRTTTRPPSPDTSSI